MPRIWTELLKHMLHRHTVISVSQQSIAEQLVETYCSVNCIGMQMPSHLWINIHHGKGMYKETQGLWHVALPLPRDVLPDGVQPTSSGLPFPASVGYRGFTLAKKRSLQARSLCVLRIWGCLKLQAVLHNQLTAIKAPEKPPMASRISALFHCMWKWRKSMSERVNGKETAQPQWDSERHPSICMGCKSVTLHQSHAAQEEVNAGNETQDFIWHVLTEYIDTLHKILWKEITCVSTSINICPIATQLSVMALLTWGQWIYVCHLNTSSKSIKKPLWD